MSSSDDERLRLAEARRRFDLAEARRTEIRKKSSAVILVNSVLISVLGLGDLPDWSTLLTLFPLVAILALLVVFDSRAYSVPFGEPETLADPVPEDFASREEWSLLSYVAATERNAAVNADKDTVYRFAVLITVFTVVLLLMGLVVAAA